MHLSKLTLHCEDLRNHSVGSFRSEQWPSALNHLNSPLESDTAVLRVRHGAVVGRAHKLQEVILHHSLSLGLFGRAGNLVHESGRDVTTRRWFHEISDGLRGINPALTCARQTRV
jgi:hypothetical protein